MSLQERTIVDAFPLGDELWRSMPEAPRQQQVRDPILDFTRSVDVAELTRDDGALS